MSNGQLSKAVSTVSNVAHEKPEGVLKNIQGLKTTTICSCHFLPPMPLQKISAPLGLRSQRPPQDRLELRRATGVIERFGKLLHEIA